MVKETKRGPKVHNKQRLACSRNSIVWTTRSSYGSCKCAALITDVVLSGVADYAQRYKPVPVSAVAHNS